MNRTFVKPLALAGLLLNAVVGAHADDTDKSVLTPRWYTTSWGSTIVVYQPPFYYAPDGKSIFLPNLLGFGIYRASDHKLLTRVGAWNFCANLTPDGKYVYYGDVDHLWKYSLVTGQSSLFLTSTKDRDIFAITPDGKTLSWAGEDNITYDLEQNKILATFNEPFQGTYTFLSNDRLLSSGPRILDPKGHIVADTTDGCPVVIPSPDKTKLFGTNYTGTEIIAYSASDLTELWRRPALTPKGIRAAFVSTDGTKLFVQNGDQPGLLILSTATGAISPNTFAPTTSFVGATFAAAPGKNEVLISWVDTPKIDQRREIWKYRSDDVTWRESTLLSGPPTSMLIPVQYRMYKQVVSGFQGQVFGKNDTYVYSAEDGVMSPPIKAGPSNQTPLLNPIGKQFATYESGIVSIYQREPQTILASLSTGGAVRAWGGNSRFWLINGSGEAVVYSFNGSTIQQIFKVSYGTILRGALSPDGSRIALQKQGIHDFDIPPIAVFNVDTGSRVGDISQEDQVVPSFSFGKGNLIAISQIAGVDGGLNNRLRIYRVDTGVEWVRTFEYPLANRVLTARGVISSDGAFVALTHTDWWQQPSDGIEQGTIRIYRLSDGKIVRQWDNQYLSTDQDQPISFSLDSKVLAWNISTLDGVVSVDVPPTVTSLSISTPSVLGGASAKGKITLNRIVDEDTTVTLSTTSDVLSLPANIIVASGASSVTFDVPTHAVDASTSVSLRATFDGGEMANSFTVLPASKVTLRFAPDKVSGGQSAIGTVTLNGKAGPGGVIVHLVSDHPSLADMDDTVTVLPGEKTATFMVNTNVLFKDTNLSVAASIAATGTNPAYGTTGVLKVLGTVSMSLTAASVSGGQGFQLTLASSQPAPIGGWVFTIKSDSKALVVPISVTIPPGDTSVTVSAMTKTVSTETIATLKAYVDGVFMKKASITILSAP